MNRILFNSVGIFLLIFSILLLAPPKSYSQATATIVIINADNPNEGFNDPASVSPVGGNTGTTLGAQRLNALQYAADTLASALKSNVDIELVATMDNLFCFFGSATLGSAGPIYVVRDEVGGTFPFQNTWYAAALANAFIGTDLSSNPDINATFNKRIDENRCLGSTSWYYGLDGNPPSGDIDFVVVAKHELMHGLGFLNLVGSDGALFGGSPDIYFSFLYSVNQGCLNNTTSNAERADAFRENHGLLWDGQCVNNLIAILSPPSGVHLSGRPKMYAPMGFQGGSSVSHWDTSHFPNLLMEPSINSNIQDEELELALLRDIGWPNCYNVNGITTFIPDPATYSTTDVDLAACPGFPFKFSFTARLQLNPLMNSMLSSIQGVVVELTNGNMLVADAGLLGGVGATKTVVGTLTPPPAGFIDVPFEVCLTSLANFNFFLDVIASETCAVSSCSVSGPPMSLQQSVVNDINSLISLVNSFSSPSLLSSSNTANDADIANLTDPLFDALDFLSDDNESNDQASCGKMISFKNFLEKLRKDGYLTTEQADQLINSADNIMEMLGC